MRSPSGRSLVHMCVCVCVRGGGSDQAVRAGLSRASGTCGEKGSAEQGGRRRRRVRLGWMEPQRKAKRLPSLRTRRAIPWRRRLGGVGTCVGADQMTARRCLALAVRWCAARAAAASALWHMYIVMCLGRCARGVGPSSESRAEQGLGHMHMCLCAGGSGGARWTPKAQGPGRRLAMDNIFYYHW